MPGPDPRAAAMQQLMNNPPPTIMERVGEGMNRLGGQIGELPIQGSVDYPSGDIEIGAELSLMGDEGYQARGMLTIKDQQMQRLAIEALKMGATPRHVKAWLEMVKNVPSRAGASYEDDRMRASMESQLPGAGPGDTSMSASYKLPEMGGFKPEAYGEFSTGPAETRGMAGIRGRF